MCLEAFLALFKRLALRLGSVRPLCALDRLLRLEAFCLRLALTDGLDKRRIASFHLALRYFRQLKFFNHSFVFRLDQLHHFFASIIFLLLQSPQFFFLILNFLLRQLLQLDLHLSFLSFTLDLLSLLGVLPLKLGLILAL